jgi:hypothetical protein
MKYLTSRLIWGLVLIVGGALLLLDTFDIFQGGELFWTIASAVVGVLFITVYINNHTQWWALIPGIIFLAIAVLIGLDTFLPGFQGSKVEGLIILGGIALSFLFVYLASRINWWAIIPAGIMATVAIVSLIDTGTNGNLSGGILFLGFGITFALVALLPNPIRRMAWAWIPAVILAAMGIIFLVAAGNLINYLWPLIIILLGVWLIARTAFRRQK